MRVLSWTAEKTYWPSVIQVVARRICSVRSGTNWFVRVTVCCSRPAQLLVQDLLVAKRDLVLPKVLKRLSRYEAIILDDLGYVQQSQQEMEVLFTLLAYRYERGSLMITSNLPFSQWEAIFKNPMTTAAAIDRLVHHSVILELNLPSYRLEASKRQASGEDLEVLPRAADA